jgi:hypothetical protein
MAMKLPEAKQREAVAVLVNNSVANLSSRMTAAESPSAVPGRSASSKLLYIN